LALTPFDRRSKEVRAKRLVTQLAKLGFDAMLTPLKRLVDQMFHTN
jgi:hypothetical protein